MRWKLWTKTQPAADEPAPNEALELDLMRARIVQAEHQRWVARLTGTAGLTASPARNRPRTYIRPRP